MVRTQIYLTEVEQRRLRSLSRATGRSVSDLIRDAIDRMISQRASAERLTLLRRGRGIWKDRTDLPDFTAIRRESDRRIVSRGR